MEVREAVFRKTIKNPKNSLCCFHNLPRTTFRRFMKDPIMLKYPTLILLTLLISVLGVSSAMANITFTEPRILLLSIDAEKHMIDRHSKPHKALVRTLRRGLQKSGYRVFERNRDQINENRQNRRDAIRLAKKAGLTGN